MRANHHEIDRLLRAGGGVVARRDQPRLAEALRHAVRCGRLAPVLPGVYAAADATDEFGIRLRALQVWDPDAVLTGRAAARFTFWPELPVTEVDAAVPTRKGSHRGFRFSCRRVPSELVAEVHGLRCATPALTALDLSASELGGDAIDTVLRTRAANLDQLHEAIALTPGRRGNTDRRLLLLDSRDRPWSEAERDLHRLLRAAGVDGWTGNHPLDLGTGMYWVDVAFPELKLAVEVDGWEFHGTRDAFESDRWRQNDLVLAGWVVLRFTARMVRDRPQVVVAAIERAVRRARH